MIALTSLWPSFDALARLSAERMFNCLVQGSLIAVFAWILLRIAGRRNSSTRFAVWFSALVAVAVLPWLAPLAVSRGAAADSATSSVITAPGSWALAIFFIWAAIASLALLRVALGLWQLKKLRASCTPIDHSNLDPALQKTLRQFASARPVQLCISNRLGVPTAIGFFNPAVVIPTWAMQEFSAAELNWILIHELAHLHRWDDWTNLAQKILRALLFFHPAVWWIEPKLSLEREMACDDVVLSQTTTPRAYAECLVAIAEKSFLRRGLALAQAVVSRMRHTSLRVSQILDGNRSSATLVWRPALYLVAAFSVVCIAALSRAPELVAFKDMTPTFASAQLTTSSLTQFVRPAFARPTLASFKVHSPAPTLAKRNSTRPYVASARTEQTRTTKPQDAPSLAAQATRLQENVATPPVVLVVMQGEQNIQSGSLQWTICVWRVTVWNRAQISAQKGLPAKSI